MRAALKTPWQTQGAPSAAPSEAPAPNPRPCLANTCSYGDAKTLPAVDVHVREGMDAVCNALASQAPKLDIRLNASEWLAGLGGCGRLTRGML